MIISNDINLLTGPDTCDTLSNSVSLSSSSASASLDEEEDFDFTAGKIKTSELFAMCA